MPRPAIGRGHPRGETGKGGYSGLDPDPVRAAGRGQG